MQVLEQAKTFLESCVDDAARIAAWTMDQQPSQALDAVIQQHLFRDSVMESELSEDCAMTDAGAIQSVADALDERFRIRYQESLQRTHAANRKRKFDAMQEDDEASELFHQCVQDIRGKAQWQPQNDFQDTFHAMLRNVTNAMTI